MLHLKLPTDPRWVNLAEMALEDVLTDHAWCEQKAATSGITLIVAKPGHRKLVDEMTALVAEEWGHFRKVLREIKIRQLTLGPPRKDDYVIALGKFKWIGRSKDERLVDQLLMNALIEARSCERFRLLALHLNDEKLREFYHEFMISEAGHYRTFMELADEFMESEKVKKRWEAWLNFEAEVMQGLAIRGDRVHG